MAMQSWIVAVMALSFPMLPAADLQPPADPGRPLTVQTTTTQTWVPGRWVRVEAQEVWQPGHWETVQTTTTLPGAASASAATTAVPPTVVTSVPAASPSWVSERWEQTPDGWNRYAGRWSNQPDVIVERRPIEPPTRTVVVERPVETVVVERPAYSSYSNVSVGVGVGWGSPYWNVGVGYGVGWPGYWGTSVCVPVYRHSHYCPPVYRPSCPPVVRPPGGGYVRHH